MRTVNLAPKLDEETVRLMLPNGDYLDATILADKTFRLRSCTREMRPLEIRTGVAQNAIYLKI